jgi:DNA-binding MarR family transcriptional regulator
MNRQLKERLARSIKEELELHNAKIQKWREEIHEAERYVGTLERELEELAEQDEGGGGDIVATVRRECPHGMEVVAAPEKPRTFRYGVAYSCLSALAVIGRATTLDALEVILYEQAKIPKNQVGPSINELYKSGLVYRSPSATRDRLIQITERGKRAAREVEADEEQEGACDYDGAADLEDRGERAGLF